jgi:uncharacterized OsmC-like protein
MKVTATYHGGYSATVEARGHTVDVDEPADFGGSDGGFMPTELLFAGLASCFALALGHAARKRELRYDRVVVSASADVPHEDLATLVERAERFCWVSNTFAAPPDIEYRATEVP